MDTNIQKRNVDTLRNSNRLLSFALIALSALLFVTVIGLIRSAGREKVIVVPATIERPITVQGDQVSESYLEQWGLWVAHLILDVSYTSIEVTRNALLKYVHPASHGALSNKLEFEAQAASLSGGWRKRLAIVVGLVQKPDVLLLDTVAHGESDAHRGVVR